MNEPQHDYRELKAWQLAMDLAEDCYRLIKQFPSVDRYGLESQIFSTALDVPAQIAAAYTGGQINPDKLIAALSGIRQLQTLIQIAGRIYYCNGDQMTRMLKQSEIVRLTLTRMSRSVVKVASECKLTPL